VFHHYPDLDALFADAAATQAARHWSLLKPVDPGLPVEERVGAVVDQRAALYERISPVRRVACRHEGEWPLLADRLQQSRAALRRHLRQALAPELAGADRAVVAAVEAAGAWETWEVLRVYQGLPVSTAKRALATLIAAPIREGISPWVATSSS
jgi:TetR/AcrR family transcriptional regulator, regulator of autoinduction and epiphytic fitness